MLAAVEKGLGGCWLTAPLEAAVGDELRELFAPGKGPLVAMLTIGYPAQNPKAPTAGNVGPFQGLLDCQAAQIAGGKALQAAAELTKGGKNSLKSWGSCPSGSSRI